MARQLPVDAPCAAEQISFLNLLFLVQASGGCNSLVSITGGYQENLVAGGAGSVARPRRPVQSTAPQRGHSKSPSHTR